MKNLSVSIFSSTSSIRNDKSHHASSVRFHFDPYSAHVAITVPTKLPTDMSQVRAQIREIYSKTEGSLFSEEGKVVLCTRHGESIYLSLQNIAKELVHK